MNRRRRIIERQHAKRQYDFWDTSGLNFYEQMHKDLNEWRERRAALPWWRRWWNDWKETW